MGNDPMPVLKTLFDCFKLPQLIAVFPERKLVFQYNNIMADFGDPVYDSVHKPDHVNEENTKNKYCFGPKQELLLCLNVLQESDFNLLASLAQESEDHAAKVALQKYLISVLREMYLRDCEEELYESFRNVVMLETQAKEMYEEKTRALSENFSSIAGFKRFLSSVEFKKLWPQFLRNFSENEVIYHRSFAAIQQKKLNQKEKERALGNLNREFAIIKAVCRLEILMEFAFPSFSEKIKKISPAMPKLSLIVGNPDDYRSSMPLLSKTDPIEETDPKPEFSSKRQYEFTVSDLNLGREQQAVKRRRP
jgi:hypothetical protein